MHALDFDPDENVLWAAVYLPVNGQSLFYKIRPSDGTVLHTCSTPFRDTIGGNDTLAIARPADLNGRKVLLTDAGEFLTNLLAIDVETCAVLKIYALRMGVTGIDVDEETGNLIGVEAIPTASNTIWNMGPAPYRQKRKPLSMTVQGAVEDISLPTKLRSVAVDAGHGRHCPDQIWDGVQGPTFGDREDTIALSIATNLQANLTNRQRRAILTRETECIVELDDRVRIANEEGVDLFVSVHLNSGVPTANGTEVWYWVNHPRAAEAERLAGLLVNAQAGLGLSNRGIKRAGVDSPWNRRMPFVLRQRRRPPVLSEVAFLTNSQLAAGQTTTDEERLHDPGFLQQVAGAMGEAIDNFFRQ